MKDENIESAQTFLSGLLEETGSLRAEISLMEDGSFLCEISFKVKGFWNSVRGEGLSLLDAVKMARHRKEASDG